ncbi:hypothetical protein JOB18_022686 [Solea senegalensis]|uniref:Uncharacterized protein n=1 Tax=Solea senegalensis TaxID=28829 RepID=A0AAV6QX52_SOLSE|nr:hypothetical protein JOB18_022686 [Solea senegalensis]
MWKRLGGTKSGHCSSPTGLKTNNRPEAERPQVHGVPPRASDNKPPDKMGLKEEGDRFPPDHLQYTESETQVLTEQRTSENRIISRHEDHLMSSIPTSSGASVTALSGCVIT